MARILVVDDESPVRSLIASGLRCDGHMVACACTGEEAIEKLGVDWFDLVVVDLIMPGINGYETIERIRRIPGLASLPVILLSNRGDQYNLVHEAELGVIDHVQKPFGHREIEDAVRRVLTATPEKLEELRVIRDEAAQVYKDSMSLIELARSTT